MSNFDLSPQTYTSKFLKVFDREQGLSICCCCYSCSKWSEKCSWKKWLESDLVFHINLENAYYNLYEWIGNIWFFQFVLAWPFFVIYSLACTTLWPLRLRYGFCLILRFKAVQYIKHCYYRPIPSGSEFSLPLFFRELTRALSLPFLSSRSR